MSVDLVSKQSFRAPVGRQRIEPTLAVQAVMVHLWPLLLAMAVAGLVGLLFWRRFVELVHLWRNDENYSHGFFIPLVSGYLAWRWLRQAGPPVAGNLTYGLVWLTFGCVVHLAAVVIWLPPVDFLGLAAMLYGLAILAGGRNWAAGFTFPILYLFVAFPLPVAWTESLSLWLQGVVTSLAAALLQMIGPVYREGNFLFLPGHPLEVGQACSGLRQLQAFVALALLVAYLCPGSWPHKFLLVAGAVPVAIAGNVLRVLLMACVLRGLGPEWLSGAYHSVWGMVALLAGSGLLLGWAWWLKRLLPLAAIHGRESVTPCQFAPSSGAMDHTPSTMTHRLSVVLVVLAATTSGQWTLQSHLQAGEAIAALPELEEGLTSFPVSLGAWFGKDIPPATLPYLLEADDRLHRRFTLSDGPAAGTTCLLSLIHFRDGRDRQHHPLICYRVAGFTELTDQRARLPLPGGSAICFRFRRGATTAVVMYWHYTFLPPAANLSLLQRFHQQRVRALPSLTVEVFADGAAPLEALADFACRVDVQLRKHVPPEVRVGCDTLPIRYFDGHGDG